MILTKDIHGEILFKIFSVKIKPQYLKLYMYNVIRTNLNYTDLLRVIVFG